MKLTFYGGTGSVTGANFLLEHENLKILVDCGLMQGSESAERFNRGDFPYKPEEINFLLITHAHMDHVGRIPKLVRDGFVGKIISTPPTKDIAEPLLYDEQMIMDHESRKGGVLPIFEKTDVERAISLWNTVGYHQKLDLGSGLSIYLRDSGHILGSSMIEISDGAEKIVFTGDLGNSPSLLLNDTEEITDADYIVMESVYGDRNHESKDKRREELKEAIKETIDEKRLLIIPSFSVERTQMIIYEMNEFFENHELSQIPVFLDSPLAIRVTKIYEKYTDYLNKNIQEDFKRGDDPFKFPKLKSVNMSYESEKIERTPNPKIILAGSGMSSGGRVVHHEKDHVSDKNTTILLVGYQALGTLGRQLEDGAKTVKIFNETLPVKAKISKIEGYSSHKDSDHLVGFVEMAAEKGTLKKVFCVMGEPKASLFLIQRLRDEIDVNAALPEYGETVEL
jgi:metallo-beta-lactamase family protein